MSNGRTIATCHSCGGRVAAIAEPGRWREYRGTRCVIPANLDIPTCQSCGLRWLDAERIRRLSESFEEQRLRIEAARAL